jgi:hypothetical protein
MVTTKIFGVDVVTKYTGALRPKQCYIRPDGSEGPSIEINVEDVEECKEAVSLLYAVILNDHGVVAANEIFSKQMLSKRQIAADKNYQLLIAVMHRMKSQSIEKVAAEIAKENDSRPLELRYGPSGTTNPSVMAKQIRRLIKATRRRR